MNENKRNTPRRLITPREANSCVPGALNQICGNARLVAHLEGCLARPDPVGDADMMVTGDPGTGKTSSLIAYLRLRLNDPNLGHDDNADFFTTLTGRTYGFVRIDGAAVRRDRLLQKIEDATANSCEHCFVLLDEAGELYWNGLEDCLRGLGNHPRVTTYATAQNFHSKKRRTDTPAEDEARLRAFLRRFPVRLTTEAPTDEAFLAWVKSRLSEWAIDYEDEKTVELVVQKSHGVVGFALGCLVMAIAEGRKLTRDLVMRYTPDPLDE